jgi:hypothetical protein
LFHLGVTGEEKTGGDAIRYFRLRAAVRPGGVMGERE